MLIEKEALLSKFDPDGRNLNPIEVRSIIVQAPTVDAVPVVRCGECKLHGSCTFEETFATARLSESHRYCGAGERKDGENNASQN